MMSSSPSPREPEFAVGDEILFRYRGPEGRVQGAFPVRVIEDAGDRLVVWLAPDTPVRYYATATGGDPRDLPIEARFAEPYGSVARTWRGPGVVRVIPLAETYQVVHFWERSGAFAGWYVNLESAKTVSGRRVDTVDWQLDLWIGADRTPAWKDEDEAEAAVAAHYLRPEELATARATGEAILARLDDWMAELGDWTAWQPPGDWSIPKLPADWAD